MQTLRMRGDLQEGGATLTIIKKWPKDEKGVHVGVCLMCRNTGITHFLYGLPSGYCGPCYRSGFYKFRGEEE